VLVVRLILLVQDGSSMSKWLDAKAKRPKAGEFAEQYNFHIVMDALISAP
jgi:hypothetical protein